MPDGLERRVFLGLALAGSAGWGALEWRGRIENSAYERPAKVRIAEFTDAGVFERLAEVRAIRKADSEWKRLLAVDQYMVTRRGDTEFAFAGEFWNFQGRGLYRCVCCGTALFDSKSKISTGDGWPAFTEPIAAENVAEHADRTFGMSRTEVACRRCGAHLGHLFEDGPLPSRRRYCINSVALRFCSVNLT